MIQRIQSVFLFLASGAAFGQFGLPYLQTAPNDPARAVPSLADGVFNPFDNVGLLGLTILSGVVSLAAVFLFRNRSLQGRLTIGAVLASALLLVLMAFSAYQTLQAVPPNGSVQYHAGLALPIVALLFQWRARRSIRKDEQLVRSIDRLR